MRITGGAALTENLIPDVVRAAEPAVVSLTNPDASPSGAGERYGMAGPNLGTGFIISPDGYILTNAHVIQGAAQIDVTVNGYAQPFAARVVGRDPALDLAVLKISAPRPLPTLPLGNSKTTQVGQWDVAIGDPYGLANTVTVGVISAEGRPLHVGDRSYTDLLQTDAPINPGNSGGPLLNLSGQVIGINTAVNSQGQGIGFAIPIDVVRRVLPSLLTHGFVVHPWLGVWIETVSERQAQAYGAAPAAGAMVVYVYAHSPAARCGLKIGDVVVAVNGMPVGTAQDLTRATAATPIGHDLHLVVRRRGDARAIHLSATLAQEPSNLPPPPDG
jgi:serine protease Do